MSEQVVQGDPWKAVHRIKVKHEAVVRAAVIALNCYKWQGEQQSQFLAEAMTELEQAVSNLPQSREEQNDENSE